MELLNPPTILTRHGFCPLCSVNNLPKSGTQFKTIGAKGTVHMKKCEHNPRWAGYTPHLYYKVKQIGENVVYERICCVVGCGIIKVANDEEQVWEYLEKEDRWVRGIMTLTDWNSLVMYKKDLDYFI